MDQAPSVPPRGFFEEHLRASQAARERFIPPAPDPPLSEPEPPPSVPEAPAPVPEPPPPVPTAAPELAPAALCPSCGNCTRHDMCEGCGTDMAEALALWRSTGITPEGLATPQPAPRANGRGADEASASAVPNAPRAPAFGGLDEIAGIFSMLQTDTSSMLQPDSTAPAVYDRQYEPAPAPEAVAGTSAGTPRDVMDSFPVTVLAKDGPECPICLLEPLAGESVLILPCFHVYHHECITRWLQLKKYCPVCKHDVSMMRCPPPTPDQMGNDEANWQGSY